MPEHPVRKLDLELLVTGELSASKRQRVEVHLQNCAECMAVVTRLQQQKSSFLHHQPYEHFAAHPDVKQLVFRAVEPAHSITNYLKEFLATLVASLRYRRFAKAAFALLLFTCISIPVYRMFTTGSDAEITYKGQQGDIVSFLHKRNGQIGPAGAVSEFKKGDKLQLMYRSEGRRYVTLLSVSGAGELSFYQPDTSSQFCSIESLAPSRLTAYPQSIVLNELQPHELIVVVFSDSALLKTQVMAWVSRYSPMSKDLQDLQKNLTQNPLTAAAGVKTLLIGSKSS